jgi:hypothetical protein
VRKQDALVRLTNNSKHWIRWSYAVWLSRQ